MSNKLVHLIGRAEHTLSRDTLAATLHCVAPITLLGDYRISRRVVLRICAMVSANPNQYTDTLTKHQRSLLPVHAAMISRAANVPLCPTREVGSCGVWASLSDVEKRRFAATVSSESAATLIETVLRGKGAAQEWVSEYLGIVPDEIFQTFVETACKSANVNTNHSEVIGAEISRRADRFPLRWIKNRVEAGRITKSFATSAVFCHGDTILTTATSATELAFALGLGLGGHLPLDPEMVTVRIAAVTCHRSSQGATSLSDVVDMLLLLWDMPRSVSLPFLAQGLTSALGRSDLTSPVKGTLVAMASSLAHTTSSY